MATITAASQLGGDRTPELPSAIAHSSAARGRVPAMRDG